MGTDADLDVVFEAHDIEARDRILILLRKLFDSRFPGLLGTRAAGDRIGRIDRIRGMHQRCVEKDPGGKTSEDDGKSIHQH